MQYVPYYFAILKAKPITTAREWFGFQNQRLPGGIVTTYGYEMAQRISDETMNIDLLHKAVDNTNPDGHEGLPFSDGLRWIRHNPLWFRTLIEQAGTTVEAFFRQHLSNPHLGSLLNDRRLLEGVEAKERLAFMTEVFISVGSINRHWLETPKAVGITDDQLAGMILTKLKVDKPNPARNGLNFTKYDFVENGGGRVSRNARHLYFDNDEPTYWSVLTNEQLLEAFLTIVEKAPNLLFIGRRFNEVAGVADKLAIRFGDEAVNQLVKLAADQLESLDDVDPDVMGQLPLGTQYKTAKRLAHNGIQLPVAWVVEMALALGAKKGGLELLRKFEAAFTHDPLAAYRLFYSLKVSPKAKRPEDVFLKEIEALVNKALKERGWTIGTLTEGYHKDMRQLCVEIDQTGRAPVRVIQDRSQSGYRLPGGRSVHARAGDVVAFRANATGGVALAKGVWSVYFTLIHRPK